MNTCDYCGNICNRRFCNGSCSSNWYWSIKPDINITEELHQVIEGTLLGDAGLELDLKQGFVNPRYYFKQKSTSIEYVKYVAEKFNLIDQIKLSNGISSYSGNPTQDARFKTKASKNLLSYYERWYPNKKKIVPQDIELTPIVILHWYLDDGHFKKRHNNCGRIGNYGYPTLCTHGFTKTEIETILMPKMLEKGIKSRIQKVKQKGYSDKYIIEIRRPSVLTFFDYIGQSPVECLKHKWSNRQEIEKTLDSPEKFKLRAESRKRTMELKKLYNII